MENPHTRQLRKLMTNIGGEFDKRGPEILELFTSHGEDILKSHPEVVEEMINLVEWWITTEFYQKIVEKMVEAYNSIEYKHPKGLATILLEKMDADMTIFASCPKEFLRFAKTIADDSLDSRYMVLRATIVTLESSEQLEKEGKEILERLESDGQAILGKYPMLLTMTVAQVYNLIRSPMYLEIVKEMVKIFKETPWGPDEDTDLDSDRNWIIFGTKKNKEGPLQYLVSHQDLMQTKDKKNLQSLAKEIVEEIRGKKEKGWPQEKPLKDMVRELDIWGQKLGQLELYTLMQKIIKECKKEPGWPKEEPLKSLVHQLNNLRCLTDQKALLSLIQNLVTVGETSKSRTECLNVLMTRAQYGGSERDEFDMAELMEEFEVTEEFIHTLELLLKYGGDPTCTAVNETLGPKIYSALYHFLQRIVFILAHKKHLSTALMMLLPSFLTEKYLNHREPQGNGTVLHALFDINWVMLPGILPDNLFEHLKEIVHNVVKVKPALLDTTDCNGQTVLHVLAKALSKRQRIEHKLKTIITLVTTKKNVQVSDHDQVTPLSWILLGKAKWKKGDSEGIFSAIENDFLSKGANAKIAEAGLMVPIYTWVTDVLSVAENTSKDTESLRTFIEDVKDSLHPVTSREYQSFIKEFKLEFGETVMKFTLESGEMVWKMLARIENPKFIPLVSDILKILTKHQGNAQDIWRSIVAIWRKEEYLTIHVLEMLCLCVENGAQPTDNELETILSYPEAITRKEKFAKPIIKAALSLPIIYNFFNDMAFLTDYYKVSDEMRKLGCKLMHKVYRTPDDCLKSKKLIDFLLFISDKEGKIKPLKESFVESSFRENWLRRNPLHIAVIFLHAENSMKWFPLSLVTKYLHETDIHGCTPLHLAYLHQNEHAVNFLLSRGARENVTDHFRMSPKSLGSRVTVVFKNGQPQTVRYIGKEIVETTEEHPDVKHFNLCKSVLEAKGGVLKKMKPMLVIDEDEAKTLFRELHTLFERLVRGTEYAEAKIKLCGSSRERMKTVCLDEADIQLRFKHLPLLGNIIAGKKWESHHDFLPALGKCLINNLGKISWEGINLRPTSVLGPWLFIREGDSPNKGMEVDVDVVAILVRKAIAEFEEKLQRELLEEGHRHRLMLFSTLETWQPKQFKPTFFAYEWEIIDSFPTTERLAIVICKALVQAYNTCRGDSSRVKMPITSYVIKTSVFYMLSYHAGYVKLIEKSNKGYILKKALESVEKDPQRKVGKKLPLNRSPRWATDADLDQYGEEARVRANKVFRLIKCLAEQGWELESYWVRDDDGIQLPFIKAITRCGKTDFILDVCEYALDRLSPSVFIKEAC